MAGLQYLRFLLRPLAPPSWLRAVPVRPSVAGRSLEPTTHSVSSPESPRSPLYLPADAEQLRHAALQLLLPP